MNTVTLPRLCAPFLLLFSLTALAQTPALPRLQVSANQRYLVRAGGQPFFYLGDTAWELFHRLNREDATRYLEIRARQGYTVIQAVALAEFNGLNAPNAYGHLPLTGNDPLQPALRPGPADDYWDHVDFVVSKANSLGLYIGFPAHLGRQVESQVGPGAGDLHAAKRRGLRRVAGTPLQGRRAHLDPGWRPSGGDCRPAGDHPGHGARPAPRRRRHAPDHLPPHRRQRLG